MDTLCRNLIWPQFKRKLYNFASADTDTRLTGTDMNIRIATNYSYSRINSGHSRLWVSTIVITLGKP